MTIDNFKIRRGLLADLFTDGDVNKGVAEGVKLEEGCWYLCTDTADLFLGVKTKDPLTLEDIISLKRINGTNAANHPTTEPDAGDGEPTVEVLGAYFDENNELKLVLSDGEEKSIGDLVGDLDNFATTKYVDDAIAGIPSIPTNVSTFENDAGYLTEQDLSDYAKTTDIPSLEGLATISYVNETLKNIDIPENVVTEEDLDAKGYLTNEDTNTFATKEEVKNLASVDDITTAIAGINVPTKVTDLDNDAGYITEDKLDNYTTQDEVKDFISEISDGYVTDDELGDLSGYTVSDYVTEAIDRIDIPEPELTDYAMKAELQEAIAKVTLEKADSIPFTTSKIVNKDVGGFTVGEDINGWSIARILAKLLGLPWGDESAYDTNLSPDIVSIIKDLVDSRKPFYQATTEGALEEVPYEYNDYYTDTTKGTTSGFYQIKDSTGVIIESGYEHYTEAKEMFYMIALPSELKLTDNDKNVVMHTWHNGSWEYTSSSLTCDVAVIAEAFENAGLQPPETIEGYTLWVNTDGLDAGISYRFIIKEV